MLDGEDVTDRVTFKEDPDARIKRLERRVKELEQQLEGHRNMPHGYVYPYWVWSQTVRPAWYYSTTNDYSQPKTITYHQNT
jgi:hypothetical protein